MERSYFRESLKAYLNETETGKQESIFDLAAGYKGDVDNAFIQTIKEGKEVGYGQLKDKAVLGQKRVEQRATTRDLQEGSSSIRSKVRSGNNAGNYSKP